jgi:catechol 2,3-dioxygenase-like lactoylglutathione lyase family enzyme
VIFDLHHVQLACPKDAEGAARQFYGDILGLEQIDKPEPLKSRGGCWFRIGSRQLHLGVEEPFRPATKAHPAFEVSDATTLFERLEAANIWCAWDDALQGTLRFYAKDPWGNRLEFVESREP